MNLNMDKSNKYNKFNLRFQTCLPLWEAEEGEWLYR